MSVDLITAELVALEDGRQVTHAFWASAPATHQRLVRGARPGVQPGTPAPRAGLKAGDVIVAFNGIVITSEGRLIDSLAGAHPVQPVQLTVQRGTSRVSRSAQSPLKPPRRSYETVRADASGSPVTGKVDRRGRRRAQADDARPCHR